MTIQQKFRKSSEFIKSFNAIDIITGSGIGIFHGSKATTLSLLSNNAFDSDSVTTIFDGTPTSTGVWQKIIDIDFTAKFLRTATIEGIAILNISAGINAPDGALNKSVRVIAKVKKGSTILVTKQSNDMVGDAGGNVPHSKRFAIELDIPKTHFNIGNILKLTIEIWFVGPNNQSMAVGFGHDGANRNDIGEGESTDIVIEDDDDTTLKFQVPCRTFT